MPGPGVDIVCMAGSHEHELPAQDRGLLSVREPRAEAAIARQLEQESLKEAIQSRDEVLAVVAHDLQNPGAIGLAVTPDPGSP